MWQRDVSRMAEGRFFCHIFMAGETSLCYLQGLPLPTVQANVPRETSLCHIMHCKVTLSFIVCILSILLSVKINYSITGTHNIPYLENHIMDEVHVKLIYYRRNGTYGK